MSEPTVAKSNPFNDLNGLLAALAKAPQDKQGAFRVATWRMVIQEIINIQEQLSLAAKREVVDEAIEETKKKLEETRQQLEANLNEKMSADDADTILF